MLTLHLGVLDLSYGDKGGTTTGEVAGHLEKKFHVMRIFVEEKFPLLQKSVEDAITEQFDTGKITGKVPVLTGIDINKIETAFRYFLQSREMEKILPFKIISAEEGISHRFKNANNKSVSVSSIVEGTEKDSQRVWAKKRKPRPAFIDTGLYSASFKAWLG